MRTLFGFGLIRIRGESMAPYLRDGDYVLIRRYGPIREPLPGDVIIYDQKAEGLRVKRLSVQRSDGSFEVRGDGVFSAPAFDLGPVQPSQFRGRVITVIRKPGPMSDRAMPSRQTG